MFWTMAAIVAGTGFQAYSQIQAGKAKQKYYDSEAKLSQLRTRTSVVNSKEKGVKVLRDLNRNVSTLFTYKAMGGADPSSGSALTHALYAYRLGAEDFNVQAIQADLDDKLGIIEYRNLKIAGDNAKRAGYNAALMTIIGGAVNLGMSGFGSGGGASSTGTPGFNPSAGSINRSPFSYSSNTYLSSPKSLRG